jgi:hypothetical protein
MTGIWQLTQGMFWCRNPESVAAKRFKFCDKLFSRIFGCTGLELQRKFRRVRFELPSAL